MEQGIIDLEEVSYTYALVRSGQSLSFDEVPDELNDFIKSVEEHESAQ